MPKTKIEKIRESKERQKEYNSLTTVEKIQRLNKQVGSNIGALKQRKRLKKQLKK